MGEMGQCQATCLLFFDKRPTSRIVEGRKTSVICLSVCISHPYQCHCNQHQSLLRQRFVIDQDDSDLLCLLLYCSKKPALYELYRNQAVGARHRNLKESDQVIELLWKVGNLAVGMSNIALTVVVPRGTPGEQR